jgi:imidazolonepropionase-like amidohydrolase
MSFSPDFLVRCGRLVALLFLVFFPAMLPAEESPAIAFLHVDVIPMNREGILRQQTVLVERDRIVAVAPDGELVVPEGARTIDGTGKFLLPGLVDSHMHLDKLVEPRPRFGDAPLFLASGVTTVVNLRGGAEHLAIRKEIAEGRLLGPTLYTSGEFVNEPRVRTPDEVEKEVVAQKNAGYDLVKHHQIVDDATWRFLTTTGLDRASFLRLAEAGRKAGIPVVGHGPESLDLDVVVEARMPLAHIGEFNHLYLMPSGLQTHLKLAGGALLLLLLIGLGRGVATVARIVRRRPRPELSAASRGIGRWFRLVCAGALVAGILAFLLVPGAPASGSIAVLVLDSTFALALAAATVALLRFTLAGFASPGTGRAERAVSVAASLAAVVFVVSLASFWIPVAWRSSDAGLRRMARSYASARIPIHTTLVIYDRMFAASLDGMAAVEADPVYPYLTRARREQLRADGPPVPPMIAKLFAGYPAFTRRIARALAAEGVPLVAGTDAFGIPVAFPGSSLLRELELIHESGLSPWETLKSATVNAAALLGKEKEFGQVVPGERADLLLVDRNPLEDLAALSNPAGVLLRGRWLPREELRALLEPLGKD